MRIRITSDTLSRKFSFHVVPLIRLQNSTEGTDRTTERASTMTSTRSEWYGFVNGRHRYGALLELIEGDFERCHSFSWPDTILKGGHDLQELK